MADFPSVASLGETLDDETTPPQSKRIVIPKRRSSPPRGKVVGREVERIENLESEKVEDEKLASESELMADATDDADGVDDDCKEEDRWSRAALTKFKYLVVESSSSWENIEKEMEQFKWKNAKGKEKEYGIAMLKKKAADKGWEKKAVSKESPLKNYIKRVEHERLMKEKDETIEALRAEVAELKAKL